MTNEEIQKLMEFVVERQEVFAENMDKAEKRMSQLERQFVPLFNVINETKRIQKEFAESQKPLRRKLAEAQTHPGDRLNALINVVEKFIRERRDGIQST